MPSAERRTLILGIGNLLLGDEGVGVEVVRRLSEGALPAGVACLDGGTGSFALLEPMQLADRIILVDATVDGTTAGTITRLAPRFSKDYPRTLTAHDIGLKDVLDAFHLLGGRPEVVLFAISVQPELEPHIGLSPPIASAAADAVRMVLDEVSRQPTLTEAATVASGPPG
jgi:hydrogenase maturation protease